METFELEGKTYIAVEQEPDKETLCTGCVFDDNKRLCHQAPNGCTVLGVIYKEAK